MNEAAVPKGWWQSSVAAVCSRLVEWLPCIRSLLVVVAPWAVDASPVSSRAERAAEERDERLHNAGKSRPDRLPRRMGRQPPRTALASTPTTTPAPGNPTTSTAASAASGSASSNAGSGNDAAAVARVISAISLNAAPVQLAERSALAAKVFHASDVDDSGAIEASELRGALSELGLRPSAKQVAEILSRFDTDGDHSIDMAEFSKIVTALEEIRVSSRSRCICCPASLHTLPPTSTRHARSSDHEPYSLRPLPLTPGRIDELATRITSTYHGRCVSASRTRGPKRWRAPALVARRRPATRL